MATVQSAKEEVKAAAKAAASAMEPFCGKEEAAKHLDRSVSTLEVWMRSSNPPPYHKKGGKVTFLRSELTEWMKKY